MNATTWFYSSFHNGAPTPAARIKAAVLKECRHNRIRRALLAFLGLVSEVK